MGTWDMPRKFVGNITTFMGRTEEAVDEIKAATGKPLNKSFNKSLPDEPELPKQVVKRPFTDMLDQNIAGRN